MTDEVGWAELGVRPDVDGFGTSLDRHLGPQLDRSGKAAGKRFGNVMKGAATAAAAGFLAGGYAAISLGKASYEEAKDAQKVGALTAQVIKSTGQAANISAKQVGNLSTNLMKKNAIDDEAIQTGANLLLTFKNIRNETGKNNDIFNQATAASLDLAASGFGSIESQAKTMGKALNDPIKGITALGRAGVTFSEEQKATIKTMVENGNILGAQKIILREVNSQVGGAAAAQADAGDKIAVAWGNVKETLGEEIVIPLVDYLAKEGVPKLEQFSGWVVKDGVPALKDFAKKAEPLAKEILPAIGTTVDTIGDGLKFAAPYAKDLVKAFNDMPEWAKTALITGGVGAFALNKVKGSSAANAFLGGNRGGSLDKPLFVTVVGGRGPGGPVVIPDENDKKNPKNKRNSRLAKGGIVAALLATGLPVPEEVGDLLGKIPDGANDGLLGGALAKLLGASNPVAGAAAYGLAGKDAVKTDIGLLFGSDEENLKKALDEFGLSYKKLTDDLTAFGNEGEYVAKVMKRLKDESSGFKKFGAVLNPFDSNDALAFSAKNTIEKNPLYDSGLSMWEQVVSQFATEVPDGFKPGPGSMKYLAKLPLEARIDVLTPGLIDSRKDVIDLTKRVDGLGRKDVKPLVKLLGIETAESSVDRLAKKIDNLNAAQFATNNINNAIDAAQERLRAAGINVNVQNMHVADGRDMVKQADRKRRRAELDGVRSW